VPPGERIRLFCALRLRDETVERLAAWQALALPDGRLVPPANLHVTLAFLGRVERERVPAIGAALRGSAERADDEIVLGAVGYRETRSVGMVVLDDEGGRATALAHDLHGRLEALGVYARDRRPWLPHVTVVRFRERPQLHPEPPDLGRFGPSDVAAFLSRLGPSGAQYEVLEAHALGG
jgi:RNA 2',3'-cyclic 3'-phosphodiesterase